MNNNNINENELFLAGVVKSFNVLYEIKGQRFYQAIIEVPRRSENTDLLPVVIPDYLMFRLQKINVGDFIAIKGEIRMRNRPRNDKHNIDVFGFALDYEIIDAQTFKNIENRNCVFLSGFVCTEPRNRVTTMTARQITDLLIANNRRHNKHYYFPVICWGHISTFASKFSVGDKIILEGRFQSRSYHKIDDNGDTVDYSICEISVTSIEIENNNIAD